MRRVVAGAVRAVLQHLTPMVLAFAALTVVGGLVSLVGGSRWWAALAGLGLLALSGFGVLAARQLGAVERRARKDKAKVASTRVQLRALETRLRQLEASQQMQRQAESDRRDAERHLARALFAALRDTHDLRAMPREIVGPLVEDLLASGDVLDARELLAGREELTNQSERTLVRLAKGLHARGYLSWARELAALLVERYGGESHTERLTSYDGELAVYRNQVKPRIAVPAAGYEARPGRILHVVGHALPATQAGYTVRTHYTVQAQREVGLDPEVAVQAAAPGGGLSQTQIEMVDGVVHYQLAGPVRGSVPFDQWFETFVLELASVVRKSRPALLHAASDFVNARAAALVGGAFGVPVVYESRGFWEETWLSRQVERFGWTDLEALERHYGLPDQYTLRRSMEDEARRSADAVVTLGQGMVARIVAGGVSPERVYLVPNAVDLKSFPIPVRDDVLGQSIGIRPEATVVGYISSLTEYEGIDTLIEGFHRAMQSVDRPMQLLIVGDGKVMPQLQQQAVDLGVAESVLFTGRVPHETVLDYYGLIDIFVVPRKPVSVAELVTPLKPYEAMATGRALVMSDVAALRGLADESGAAVTFRAGDPTDLARVLGELVNDSEKRRKLGALAAHWVQQNRTWVQNGVTYLRMYGDLGAVDKETVSLGSLTPESIDVGFVRERLRAGVPHPLEQIQTADASADEIIGRGWSWHEFSPVRFAAGTPWWNSTRENRSWDFQLHAWDFMQPILREYEATGERRYLDWALDRAREWLGEFQSSSGEGTSAWYDMALGLRSYRLAYLVAEVGRADYSDEDFRSLVPGVLRHARELYRDAAFNPTTNHGLYVALGEVAFARRLAPFPGMSYLEAQAADRLNTMVEQQFAPDGGHREHSPDYHRMLAKSFSAAMDAGLIANRDVADRVMRAHDILGWFIQPDGTLVQLGDSPARSMIHRSRQPSPSDTTTFLMTQGACGHPAKETLLVLPDTGYVVVRDPQPQSASDHLDSSYLAVMAGFHSRAHKHADDLSFVWFDDKHEVLIDTGRYGYGQLLNADSPLRSQGFYYASPERQYVESTPAHNTVTMDSENHDRRRVPYGSAIVDAEHREGWYRIRARVNHETWLHAREWLLRPGVALLVTDAVEVKDGSRHSFETWLNFPGEAEMSPSSGVFRVEFPDARPLWVVSLDGAGLIMPVRGQTEPLRGWRSRVDRELTTAWSAGFRCGEVAAHTFRTLFSFGNDPVTVAPTTPFDE